MKKIENKYNINSQNTVSQNMTWEIILREIPG